MLGTGNPCAMLSKLGLVHARFSLTRHDVLPMRMLGRSFATKQPSILVDGDRVLIRDLVIDSRSLAEYVGRHDMSEDRKREAIEKASSMGAYCLLQADGVKSGEELRDNLKEHLEHEVTQAVEKILKQSTRVTESKLKDVEKLLSEDIDPSKKTSSIGRALGGMNDLLDKNRRDSIPSLVENSVGEVRSLLDEKRFDSIPNLLRRSMEESTNSLKGQMEKLTKLMKEQRLVKQMDHLNPAKGVAFEEELLDLLNAWKRGANASLEHSGSDSKPGDIVIVLRSPYHVHSAPFTVVIEAKDTTSQAMGKTTIEGSIGRAIETRESDGGILVGKSVDVFSRDVGDWEEGSISGKPWIATTPQHLVTAIRFLYSSHILASTKLTSQESQPRLDIATLSGQVAEVKMALKHVAQIKRRSTDIRKSAELLREQVIDMEMKIKQTLQTIEHSLLKHQEENS